MGWRCPTDPPPTSPQQWRCTFMWWTPRQAFCGPLPRWLATPPSASACRWDRRPLPAACGSSTPRAPAPGNLLRPSWDPTASHAKCRAWTWLRSSPCSPALVSRGLLWTPPPPSTASGTSGSFWPWPSSCWRCSPLCCGATAAAGPPCVGRNRVPPAGRWFPSSRSGTRPSLCSSKGIKAWPPATRWSLTVPVPASSRSPTHRKR
mmetsp:Transcript_38463/g.68842  ORF Transcript_38463/g.68842 Transcript_38463/m.68842 type:complete len:205 (-) Transcript_38463:2945-3559(-)